MPPSGPRGNPVSDTDFVNCRFVTSLEQDPDWRHKTRQFISGEGTTNQDRLRSDNIAAVTYGLLSQSRPDRAYGGDDFPPRAGFAGSSGMGIRIRIGSGGGHGDAGMYLGSTFRRIEERPAVRWFSL